MSRVAPQSDEGWRLPGRRQGGGGSAYPLGAQRGWSGRVKRRVVLPLSGAVLACAVVGCASMSRSGPLPQDRAMFDRLEAAAEAAEGVPHGREMLFHMETDSVQRRFGQLRGKKPATEKELAGARRTLSALVANLEAVPDWEPEPVYRIARRVGEIEIDGETDEAAWQRAQVVSLRYTTRPDVPVAKPYTTVRLLWDDAYLYAAFDVPDESVLAPELARDERVFLHDCVELFLMPQKRLGHYWELNISPSGSVLDQYCTKYREGYFSYCRQDLDVAGLRHAGVVREEGYRMEIAVPLEDLVGLPVPPQPGQRMWLLMAQADRDVPDGPLTFYAHGQVLGSFHNVETMPEVEFVAD